MLSSRSPLPLSHCLACFCQSLKSRERTLDHLRGYTISQTHIARHPKLEASTIRICCFLPSSTKRHNLQSVISQKDKRPPVASDIQSQALSDAHRASFCSDRKLQSEALIQALFDDKLHQGWGIHAADSVRCNQSGLYFFIIIHLR